MSQPKRYTLQGAWVIPNTQDGEYVLHSDYAALVRLQVETLEERNKAEAEVERLRASSFVTAVPSDHYERVIKAGDELSWAFAFAVSRDDGTESGLIKAWNAAKEGRDGK